MPPLSVMVKPASSACNMACRYCFYRDVSSHRDTAFAGMLPPATMETLVRQALEYADGDCTFAFQGGEPTLAGLDFFRAFVAMPEKHNPKQVRLHYAIQTNGYALDDEWAAFFKQHGFLVGLSLDGPADVHNQNRPDNAGKGSWGRVMNTLRLFQKHGVEFNILSVVTGQNARHIAAIYRFFSKQNAGWLQFIPCLEPLDAGGAQSPWHLGADDYATFLITLFDLWYEDVKKGRYVSVRHLDNWLGMMLGRPPEACNMTGRCTVQFVVEGDGGIYPCDFYVTDEWRLGTVGQQSLQALQSGGTARRFVEASLPVPEACATCRWAFLCRNGCRRDRRPAPGGGPAQSYYCQAHRAFFEARYSAMRDACLRLTGRMPPPAPLAGG